MSSNNKHSENLSRQDIKTYLSTKDEQTKRVIEGKALENDFDREALEGWSSHEAGISGLDRLDKKFQPSVVKGWMIFSAAAIILAAAGIFLFNKNQPEKNTVTAINIEKTDVILPDSVNKLVEIPKTELISVSEIKIERQAAENMTDEASVPEQKQSFREQSTVDQLPILKPDFASEKQRIKKIEAKEIYLNNLKLIDYRTYRKRPNLTVESIQLTGVPADKESQEETALENKVFDVEIAYYDYISKTTLLLNEEDYKQALARCNIILMHYPDDLNALFYSGLCYYNLAEYTRAIELFKQCLTSKFNNFDEETEWLLAKSYEASGETKKAKAIFQLIKERGGYYSKKAIK